MNIKSLAKVLIIAFGLIFTVMVWLGHIQSVSLAQSGDEVTLTKVLNRSDPVVRVGEVLSFNITLENNASFTLTHVTLVDEYNIQNSGSNSPLQFAGANPPADEHDANAWVLTWTNVASPPIPPGGNLEFTVYFTAVHPQTALVNRAEARDITGTQSALADAAATDNTGETVGGAAPVYKAVSPPDSIPLTGQPITFTQIITNDGAALLTFLPLTDTYEATFMVFSYAIPTPTFTSPGQIVWEDLTTYFGDLPPFASVVVTTVFTASARIVDTVNQASTAGARDEYNNDLTAGQAQVPITIIDDTEDTDAGTPDDDNGGNDEDDNTVSTSPPVAPAVTPIAPVVALTQHQTTTTTASAAPKYLPETGYPSTQTYLLPIFALAMGITAMYVLLKKSAAAQLRQDCGQSDREG